MLINNWYVAEWSEAVKDKPVRVKILSQNLVLFRDEEGKIGCLADVCLHRGGSLGKGWCEKGNVVCPYHGWQYNTDGRVVHIPSEGEDFRINKRFEVDQYAVEERYGMIWVFMGDIDESERFPIPPFEEFDHADWKIVTTEYTWNAEASRVVENGIDIAHASFVHPDFGYPDEAHNNKIVKLEKHDWWATSSNVMYPPELHGWWRKFLRPARQETWTHPTWYMPGYVVRIQIDIRKDWKIVMFDANTPVDEHTTRTFAIQARNFMKHSFFDKGSVKRLHRILLEDAVIVEESQPYYLPETLQNELSVKSDQFMSSFRIARRKLIEEKGWSIDLDKRDEYKGKKVLCVASVNRKRAEAEGREWVFDKMPTIPPIKAPGSVADQDIELDENIDIPAE